MIKTSFCLSYFCNGHRIDNEQDTLSMFVKLNSTLSPTFSQSIHQQLQEALEEQESLKIQISEYARQVARVEELLAQKVNDLLFSNSLIIHQV